MLYLLTNASWRREEPFWPTSMLNVQVVAVPWCEPPRWVAMEGFKAHGFFKWDFDGIFLGHQWDMNGISLD